VDWKLLRSSIVIPAELHDRIARLCQPLNSVDSEIVAVRPKRAPRKMETPTQAKKRPKLLT
jgi:hypothetical protein